MAGTVRAIARLSVRVARSLGILAVVAFTLFPFLVVVSTSLKTSGEVFRSPATFVPEVLAWRNYVDIFVEIPLLRHLVNTMVIAGAATVLNLAVSAPAAYAMARVRFRGKGLFGLGTLVTQMFSPVIILIPVFKVVKTLGLLDTYAALILANTAVTIPFAVWMLIGFFRSVPVELEEAATLDGLSRVQAMVRVALPLTMPGLITTAIYTFVTAWNEFIFALVLAPDRYMQPVTMALYSWEKNNIVDWNRLMATAAVATAPTVLLFLLVRKRLTAGLMTGAIK